MTLPAADAADAFRSHEEFLRALCYRLTGSAADADDLVQDTFTRAMEHPPADTTLPWRPWLVRVATNLGRDLLRHRRRTRYVGPWLPSPIDTGDEAASPDLGAEDRYDLLESASFAFLLALEALTPLQRPVLLLRDVFDFSVRETAEALDLSEPNVKTTHHRARRAMAEYDRERSAPTRAHQENARLALGRVLAAIADQDMAGLRALLADDVCALSDGGGEFLAARVPVLGRDRVATFYMKIAARRGAGSRVEVRMLNGLPALIVEFEHGLPAEARRVVTACDLDRAGRIRRLYTVLASRKLTALPLTS